MLSTDFEPNLNLTQDNPNFISIAGGDDEDLMTVEKSQLGQAQSSLVPEDPGLQTARKSHGAVQPTVQRRRVHVEVPIPPQGLLALLRTWVIESRITGGIKGAILCITSKKISRMLSKYVDGQLMSKSGSPAAFASSRTAAHMTSRFRDIENNVEANFSHQQRGLSSEITSESAQALEAQRHSLIQEATAKMMRKDGRSADK